MEHKRPLFVFPGQGSQAIGMAAGFMAHPITKPLFEQADDILSSPLSRLMREGDIETLTKTENAQPALFVAGYAVWHYLKTQSNQNTEALAGYMAGHSLGEYTALAAAGVFTFADGLEAVQARAHGMAAAGAQAPGAMAAILGLEKDKIATLCHTAKCYVANDNADGQVVISGTMQAVDEASNMAAMEGAKKVIRLNVSGAFHTPLMQPAAADLTEALNAIPFAQAKVPVILNTLASGQTDGKVIKQNLTTQLTTPVRWRESMVWAADNGVETLLELGAGNILTGLAKRCDKRLSASTLQTPADVENWLENHKKL